MEQSNACPMCGAALVAGAKRCPACAEFFAPRNRRHFVARWWATNPNGRLVVIAFGLYAMTLILGESMNAIVNSSQHVSKPAYQVLRVIIRIGQPVVAIFGVFSVLAMVILIPFAGVRAFGDRRRRQGTVHVSNCAPNPDATPESH